MNNLIIYFLFLNLTTSFLNLKPIYRFQHNLNCKEIKIIEFNLEDLSKHFNLTNLPLPIVNETQITEHSFEGYLQNHFRNIENNGSITFEKFYDWRKNKIGTLLYDYEVREIFNYYVNNEKCYLMDFIKINNAIDEVDGADPF